MGRVRHLYSTLFKKADTYFAVVEALSRKRMGMTRKEIVKETGISDNGVFGKIIKSLVDNEFIRPYNFFGNKKRDTMIDLLIDRRGHVINICEMKYSINEFTIDKDYDQSLRNKIQVGSRAKPCVKSTNNIQRQGLVLIRPTRNSAGMRKCPGRG